MQEFVITATRSMRDYASRVVKQLPNTVDGVEFLQAICFADGEMEIDVTSSIRGRDTVLFATCARNKANIGVAEAKIELYHAVDALKRSHANSIIVFEPFVSCSRSDRSRGHNSVGLWMHFKTLASLGANHIVTYQLHSDKSHSMLDPAICAIDDVPALNLLKQYLCDLYIKDINFLKNNVLRNWAFCSVDAGGEKIARGFANAFGAPLVVAHKQRDYSKTNSIESINILSAEPIEGKVIWIVDDMIDTGNSIENLIRVLGNLKPAEINIITVHAIFSPPAGQRLQRLSAEGLLRKIIVTDTVHCSYSIPGVEIVSSVELSAKVINAIVTNSSMRKIFRVFDASLYLT